MLRLFAGEGCPRVQRVGIAHRDYHPLPSIEFD
jgi:hypothetical protein